MTRRFVEIISITALTVCATWMAEAATKKAAPKHVTASKTKSTKTTAVASRRTVAGKRTSTKRSSKKRAGQASPEQAARQHGQVAPTPDRYREIQQALATKGYLKSEPNGEWNADSQDALRRFQADQKLEQTGKLNSRSLIALGLGPSKQTEPAAASSGNLR